MKKQILQTSLRMRFDSNMSESQARYFNELVNELHKEYNFEQSWLDNLISDFEYYYNDNWRF